MNASRIRTLARRMIVTSRIGGKETRFAGQANSSDAVCPVPARDAARHPE